MILTRVCMLLPSLRPHDADLFDKQPLCFSGVYREA